jgi:hypothetical protein
MRDAHEQCHSCLQLYVYDFEVRCIRCDAAGCQFCAVRVEGEWICLGCKQEEETDGGSRDVEG